MDGATGRGLFSVLASAISEWCLMILLFFNALLGHVAAKLANSCRLPPPCALCSRLNSILGRDFCFDSLCHAHKLDISTMVFCPHHRRLACVRNLCEACLTSLAKKRKSDLDAYKLFAGMTGSELGDDSADKAPFSVDSDSSRVRRCSCCSRRIRRKNHPHGLTKAKEAGDNVANLTAQGDGVCKKNKLHHAGYQKLKIAFDSDSEVLCLDDDDDDATSQSGVTEDRRDEYKIGHRQPPKVHKVKKVPTIVFAEDTVPEKLIHPTSVDPERSLLDTQSDITSEETYEKYSIEYASKESSVAKSIASKGDMNYATASSDTEVTKELFSTSIPSYIMNDPKLAAQLANDSLKLSVFHKGSVLSPKFSEIVAAKEPSRAQEDLMIKLASISSSRGIELPWNDPTSSPKEQVPGDEAKSLDPLSPVSSRHPSKMYGIERNSSSIEPLEGGMADEQFRLQLELDRKSMSDLYRELEEERNASAIAASEAMAMINRLQEEKASMQMEALQYLRMMEEQAEYDQEAIQKLSDLLTDREKELLDLEAELDNYRQHYGDDLEDEKVIEPLGGQQTKPGISGAQDSIFGFEEEKADILKCLRKLQEELRAPACEKVVNNHQEDDFEKSSLQAELRNLSRRLEALEGNGRFLELSTNILRIGNDGRQFIQEIACQLHELRRIQASQRG